MRVKEGILAVVCVLLIGSGVTARAAVGQAGGAAVTGDDPSKGSRDVDTTIEYPLERVLAAARQAVTVYGCEIRKLTKQRGDYLECTRDRHLGVFVGSGGEKVTVKLSAAGAGTRIVIQTGKGFMGRLAKKNWSTPIFQETVRLLQSS